MKTLGNVLWLLLTGLWSAIAWFLTGVIWCITIIGIPFGKQCFKIAHLVIWPFGYEGKINFEAHPIANIIWILFGGLETALGFLIAGVLWCITIIGIPFGKQCFKLAKLSIIPFGATIDKIEK
ncbi:MAG: YccF domain-containing protein [Clostridia bacterium]|nr:YccF domain-containing protein [Clostridia bacterium]